MGADARGDLVREYVYAADLNGAVAPAAETKAAIAFPLEEIHRGDGDFFARHRSLGRYIPEGSKAGANAAAVYVTHRVLPLDAGHFGELQALSLRATEVFVVKAEAFCQRVAGRVQALVPFRPDSNLVCLAFNPRGTARLAEATRFVRALQRALSADPTRPLQLGEYFGSVTTLKREAMGDAGQAQRRDPLGRDAGNIGRLGTDEQMLGTEDVYRRARDLLDEIRRRAGDRERPEAELEYLRRLLERF